MLVDSVSQGETLAEICLVLHSKASSETGCRYRFFGLITSSHAVLLAIIPPLAFLDCFWEAYYGCLISPRRYQGARYPRL